MFTNKTTKLMLILMVLSKYYPRPITNDITNKNKANEESQKFFKRFMKLNKNNFQERSMLYFLTIRVNIDDQFQR